MKKRYLTAFVVIALTGTAAYGQTEVSVFANYCQQGMVNETGPSQASVDCVYGGPGSAYAYADFGVLKAKTQIEVYGLQTSSVLGQAHAFALFNDRLFLNELPSNAVALELGTSLFGSAFSYFQAKYSTTKGTFTQFADMTLSALEGTYRCDITNAISNSSCSLILPIPKSDSVDISMNLSVYSDVLIQQAQIDPEAYGLSASNFADTALLSQLEFLDSNGQILPGGVVTSASGTKYPIAADVPEPANLFVIGIALLVSVKALRELIKWQKRYRNDLVPNRRRQTSRG